MDQRLSPEKTTISRRAFLRHTWYALATSFFITPAVWWYGTRVEPGMLEIVRVRLPIPRLPRAFHGLTAAQISDLHLGPWVDPKAVRAAIDTVLDLKPDLAFVTGDYVSSVNSGEAALVAQELSRLRAPLGAFGVLGNNDHRSYVDIVARAVRQAGLTLLSNSNAPLRLYGEIVYIAGVDDVLVGRNDLALALSGIPDGACAILLAHEPDFADVASKDNRLALQLSGHSHGGQVRLPGGLPLRSPRLGRKYPQGLRQVGNMWLYTNRGIGMVFPPIRLNCPPEVTLFELVAEA